MRKRQIRASKLPRLELCPGSLAAENGIQDEAGPATESGRWVHVALSEAITLQTIGYKSTLNASVEAVCSWLQLESRERFIVFQFANRVLRIAEEHNGMSGMVKEAPFALPINSESELTGHPDLIAFFEDKSKHVFEYKSGRLEQETSNKSLQGKVYALMVADRWALDEVTVHILSAGNEPEQFHTFSTYARPHLDAAMKKITGICVAAMDTNAPRLTSADACKYCLAAGSRYCPESKDLVDVAVVAARQTETKPEVIFKGLAPGLRGAFLTDAKLVGSIAETIADAAKALLKEDPGAIPGWKMTEPVTIREITDPGKAFLLVNEHYGFDAEDFIETVKVSLSKLKELVWLSQKAHAKEMKKTKKDIIEGLGSILAEVIQEKQKPGFLKRVKE